MSVLKRVRAKTFFAYLSVLVVIAGTLFGANIAFADSIQVQSYQRASQSETCVAQEGETPWQVSWGPDATWKPGWEQWANKGTGGWVCTRSITWAVTPVPKNTSAPSVVTNTCSIAGIHTPGGGVCEVGDVGPGGGLIFYVDLARPSGSQFWEVGSDLGTATWGCRILGVSGLDGDIGSGAANTDAIKTRCVTAGIAARIASSTAGGFSDWFLPSNDELNQVCKYARTQSTAVADQAVLCDGTGTLRAGFASDNYWTSNQGRRGVDSVYVSFFDGTSDQFSRNGQLHVRAVRAF